MAEQTSKTSQILDGMGVDHVSLPEGTQVADMAILRSGQDLVLRDGGQDIIIENYFLSDPQPDLLSDSGSRLSPDLITSFVTHDGAVTMASPITMSDVSPVGEITELEGAGTITRTDGTTEQLSLGMPVFEGDVIETASDGATNITFIDESSFAISDNARMAIDEFVFDPSSESGVTDVSLLKGVFLFTSGLIGRENPDAVEIETPVGSIGIRGTIIGGDIKPSGEESQISVIEGAIVVRNATGESILSEQFDTVRVHDFNAAIKEIGTLDPQDVANDYGSVKSVSPSLFSSINDIIRENGQDNQTQDNATDEAAQATEGDQPETSEEKAEQPKAETAKEPAPEAQEATEQAKEDPAKAELDTVQEKMQDETTRLNQDDYKELKTRMMADEAAETQTNQTELADMGILDMNDVQESLQESTTAPPPEENAGPLEFKTPNDIDENSSPGTVVGRVGPSESVSFTIRYSLVDDAGGYFTIDPDTGYIALTSLGAANIDYETQADYDVIVRATRTSDGEYRDTSLSIDVTDVNDAPELSVGTPAMSEGASLTLTAGMIDGTDQDGDALTYDVGSLSANITLLVDGTPAGSFTQAQLDAGEVTIMHDGSETVDASLSIRAGDGQAVSAVQTLTISVATVNDAPTLSVTHQALTQGTTIMLNTSMISGTDSEGDSLTYTISNMTNGQIQVDGVDAASFTQAELDSGQVSFVHDGTVSPDAAFDVIVSDGTDQSSTETLNFAVAFPITDISFSQPSIESGVDAMMLVGADGQKIGRFTVTDANQNSGFTYEILGDDGNIDPRFEMVEVGGMAELRLKSGESLDTVETLDLTITATDAEGYQASTNITLDVRDDAILLSNAPVGIVMPVGDALPVNNYIDLGDYNLDGYEDRAYFDSTAPHGKVYFEYGQVDGSFDSGEHFNGSTAAPMNGVIVNIGDINSLGRDEIAVGAQDANGGSGAVYIHTSGYTTNTLYSTVAGAQFGANIAAIGDATGNGFADFLVTAPGEDAAYLIHGSTTRPDGDIANQAHTRIHDDNDPDTTITGISGAGDFNGDGLADFVVTLSDTDSYGDITTIVYVIFGDHEMGSSINLHDLTDSDEAFKIILTPEDTGNSDHVSVTSIGDVNGDGFDDIDITAHDADGDGERYTVHGGHVTNEAEMISNNGTADTSGESLIGDETNNTLNDGSFYEHVSLKGAGGDDRIIINNTDFQFLSGGEGHDILEINMNNFSVTVTSVVDLRDSIGRFEGFETIKLNGDSDVLHIYMSDILANLQDSANGKLVFDTTGADNVINFYDHDTTVTRLTDVGFDNQGIVVHNGEDFYQFVQAGTGHEVLLDAALVNAGSGGA